ncbi:unnamed protein product [marine sediment metagenome]|uniref:Uncharacterized protein n=1 Tax=marine sediment metagenome TaxID=412755 RepID=X1F9D1_9ZZZZ
MVYISDNEAAFEQRLEEMAREKKEFETKLITDKIKALENKVKLLEKTNNTLRGIILAQSVELPNGTFNLLGGEDIMPEIIAICQARKKSRTTIQHIIDEMGGKNK